MKKIAVLALSLVWAVCPLMAQNEEKSEEEKLAADYFSALYGDKDTVRAEFLKSELLEKYPRGGFRQKAFCRIRERCRGFCGVYGKV